MAIDDMAPLRICVISTGDASRDPRLPSLVETLRTAGNGVCVVSGPNRDPLPKGLETSVVPIRVPNGNGRVPGYLRRALPARMQARWFRNRIIDAALRTGATLFYPLARRDVEAAVSAAGTDDAVFCPPGWGSAGSRDIARIAPGDPRWSASPAGPGLPHHLERPSGDGSTLKAGRHTGKRVVLVYRGATTSPGRYLQAAFERAGVSVDRFEDVVDYDRVDPATDAVVIVESVYPAFEVTGRKPAVPTLFWIHHGEHHLDANLRLANRYGADAILLAHSWHLAHRFPVPVHRFPFGVATEISGQGERFEDRRYDVAMVAAGLNRDGGTYTSRQDMAEALTDAFTDRSLFTYGLLPEELGGVYRDARVVPNDGGTNHRPITMRVFEAIGNGARLLTEDAPGLECLLEPGRQYAVLGQDPVADTRRILADASSPAAASETRTFVMGHHTYDHRVDELFAIVDASASTSHPAPTLLPRSLAGMIDAEAEIQVVVDFGSNDLGSLLPTREIRDGDRYRGRLKPQSVDAVVVGPDCPNDIGGALAAARSYVYAIGEAIGSAVAGVAMTHPRAVVDRRGSLVRIDLGRGGYRRRPADHPLA